MNPLIAKMLGLVKSDQKIESTIDLSDDDNTTISTAAVPQAEEPEPLHQGKRRLKESYTSHWDLDYLPRKEVDEIIANLHNHKD